MSAKWVPKSRAKRNVQVNYKHREEKPIEHKEALYMKRVNNLFYALQQTIQEGPGIPQMQPGLRPLATSVIQAHAMIEEEVKKIQRRGS